MEQSLGGWNRISAVHFADGGLVDQILDGARLKDCSSIAQSLLFEI
ncbi:MAG: hypothetical protein QM718_12145 [Steroidobacteraceae bacterium]